MSLVVAGGLLAGCAGGARHPAEATHDGGSRQSGSPSPGASPGTTGTPSGGSDAAAFTPAADLVPRTAGAARRLADSVVLAPTDWGRGFTAQNPAASTPGTWPVLDAGCRWEREKLPRGVLASTSRYSRLPADGGKGTVDVTAAVTTHASVLGADDQLGTTLENVLRCARQQLRADERITGLMSLGTPFGAREQQYADASVLEAGTYTGASGGAQPYRWMVARVGTVVAAVSVTGAKGWTQPELDRLGTTALAQMLTRVQQQLKEK
ncbi:hypothetical protein ABZT03_08935 [Streptomyces sp. NPDC005574]|uniref:hypothetical protein n=1 Tax=Streptomyces sp. NPDC005574 TaxID=3156891 RepID=UPI0033B1018D